MGGGRRRLDFRPGDVCFHPGGVVNRVQVLVAKISGDGDDRVSVPELRSKLLDRGEDCSGASPYEQVIISNERQTRGDRSVFAHGHDLVRIGEVCKRWTDAGADPRDVSCAGRAL